MRCSIVENGDGPGPSGAKGRGEGAPAAVPAASVNALADAGVPMNTLPLTPERVWRRIRELKSSGNPEAGHMSVPKVAAVIGAELVLEAIPEKHRAAAGHPGRQPLLRRPVLARARPIVGSVARVPFAADASALIGASAAVYARRTLDEAFTAAAA